MSYRLEPTESIPHGIRRIADEQISKAIREIRDSNRDRHNTVHQVRKRFKKLRALVRLTRPALGKKYQKENRWFRDAGRKFSNIRDAETLIETVQRLEKHDAAAIEPATLGLLREKLVDRRRRLSDEVNLDTLLAELAERLEKHKQSIPGWRFSEKSFQAVLDGVGKTYDRACDCMETALQEPTDENWHQWRKRAKYHWYHTRLLRSVWKPVMKARSTELDRLADDLGDDHDLAVLMDRLHDQPDDFGGAETIEALTPVVKARRKELKRSARQRGQLLFAESTKRFVKRLEKYGKIWRRNSPR